MKTQSFRTRGHETLFNTSSAKFWYNVNLCMYISSNGNKNSTSGDYESAAKKPCYFTRFRGKCYTFRFHIIDPYGVLYMLKMYPTSITEKSRFSNYPTSSVTSHTEHSRKRRPLINGEFSTSHILNNQH